MCLTVVSVRPAAQRYLLTFQLQRVATDVPFSVKSASYSLGEAADDFPIEDFDISLTERLFEPRLLQRKFPWANDLFGGVFTYHDFCLTPARPLSLISAAKDRLPWDVLPFASKSH
jgi:hypothetical protein